MSPFVCELELVKQSKLLPTSFALTYLPKTNESVTLQYQVLWSIRVSYEKFKFWYTRFLFYEKLKITSDSSL